MVEQMVNSKFGKYGLEKLGNFIDQPPVSIKKDEKIPLPNPGPPPHHSPGSTAPHFVYARRKSDADVIKHVSEQTHNADCTISQTKDKIVESKEEEKFEIARIPMNNSTIENCFREKRQLEEREKYWSERFGQLQNYLKNYDRSKEEAYVQRVRSFTAEELSKHITELHLRSLRLSVEEEKEFQRKKGLNVLGGKIS